MPYGQYLGVVEETTWGTSGARTKFAKVLAGSGLQQKADRAKSSKLSANVGADPEGNFDKGQWGEGKIILPMSYDDGAGMKILKHMIGGISSTTGSNPYTHVFRRATGPPYAGGAVPTATSLGVELNYELPDSSLEARLLTGARVKGGTFSWNAGEECMLDVDLIGKQVTQIQKTALGTLPDYETYEMKFQQAALSIGGTAFGAVCSGLTFSIDNGSETRIRLGSINTQAPLRRGVSALSGSISLDWEASPSSKTLWDLFVANTSTTIVVTLTSGSHSFAVSLGKVFFNESTLTPDEGQLQGVTFPFEADHVATNTAVQATLISPNATI